MTGNESGVPFGERRFRLTQLTTKVKEITMKEFVEGIIRMLRLSGVDYVDLRFTLRGEDEVDVSYSLHGKSLRLSEKDFPAEFSKVVEDATKGVGTLHRVIGKGNSE